MRPKIESRSKGVVPALAKPMREKLQFHRTQTCREKACIVEEQHSISDPSSVRQSLFNSGGHKLGATL